MKDINQLTIANYILNRIYSLCIKVIWILSINQNTSESIYLLLELFYHSARYKDFGAKKRYGTYHFLSEKVQQAPENFFYNIKYHFSGIKSGILRELVPIMQDAFWNNI